jgi:5'-nucleotidase (EC 3.1.3.5)/3'-nucleotidase (EC 3.1.3.6)/exopolyphosphatase (EC 3.6.1.11)
MNILLTNDDGISSEGIIELAKTLTHNDHKVIVAAPSSEASGSSAGVGPVYNLDKIRCKKVLMALKAM